MDALSTAFSGLQASTLRLDVAAENIANADTPGYAAFEALLTADPNGGVDAELGRDAAAPPIPGLPPEEQPSGTDLLASLVETGEAPSVYGANARVVSAQQQMDQSLFDMLA